MCLCGGYCFIVMPFFWLIYVLYCCSTWEFRDVYFVALSLIGQLDYISVHTHSFGLILSNPMFILVLQYILCYSLLQALQDLRIFDMQIIFLCLFYFYNLSYIQICSVVTMSMIRSHATCCHLFLFTNLIKFVALCILEVRKYRT